MMHEIGWVIFNALAYIVLFWAYNKKLKRGLLTIGNFVLAIWAISASVAVFYEMFNPFGHMKEITLWPYVYLFVCNFMMFLPVLTFREEHLVAIRINHEILWWMILVVIIITIPPFFESFRYYIGHHNDTTDLLDRFTERYEDASTTYSYLSTFSRRLTYVHHAVRPLLAFVTFYMLLMPRRKHFKLMYCGVLLSDLYIFLESTILLARFIIVINFMMFVCTFLLLRNLYDNTLRKKVNGIFKYAILIAMVFQVTQTISRYVNWTDNMGQEEVGTAVYAAQYLAEGMANFNGNIVHSQYRMYGDGFVNAVTKFLGIKRADSHYRENRFHTNQFFTIVGEYWRTYGGWITLLIFMFFPFLYYSYLRKYKQIHTMTIAALIFFIMYAKLPLVGIFYHAYFVDSDQLLVMPIIMCLLMINAKTYEYGKIKKYS